MNYLLIYARGPNVAGGIGTVIACYCSDIFEIDTANYGGPQSLNRFNAEITSKFFKKN